MSSQQSSPTPDPTPEEFVRIAAQAGLKADIEYIRSIQSALDASFATYRIIRGLDVTGHESAVVFRPVKRPGAK